MPDEIIDVVTRLTYEADTDAFASIDKAFGKQFTQLKEIEAEQARLNDLIAKTATSEIAKREALSVALDRQKQKYNQIAESIGREYAANEKLQGSLQKTAKQYDSIGVNLSRIAQDAPFGFIGIANNITPFFDSITSKVNELKTAGASTGAIFTEIGTSLFSFTSIVGIAIGLLTIFSDKLFKSGEAAKEAASDYDKFIQSIQQDILGTQTNIDERINRTKFLLGVIQQGGKGASGAIKELRESYVGLFGTLTESEIKQGKNIDVLQQQIDASEKAGLALKEQAKFQSQLREAQQKEAIAKEANTRAQLRLNDAQRVFNLATPEQVNQARSALDIAKKNAETARTTLQTASGDVINFTRSVQIASQTAIRLASQSPDIFFKQDKPDTKDPLKTAKENDANIIELQKKKAEVYERYRQLIAQDFISGTVLTPEQISTRQKQIDNEVAIIDNFIAQRLNGIDQAFEKSKVRIAELKTESRKLQSDLLLLIGNIGDLPQAGSTGIQSPTFKTVSTGKNPINDILKQDKQQEAQKLKSVKLLTDSYRELAQSVILAFQTINDAEQRNLDNEIAIRERRVSEAEKIAERGNADILKLEKDRLDKTTAEREKATRRAVELNALLQASNALVAASEAITGVLKSAGTTAAEGGGIAGYIAAIIAGVAAVAGLYGSIRSIAEANKEFHDGGYTGDGHEWSVAGTVHKGEFVMPKDITSVPQNRAVLEAMYAGQDIFSIVNPSLNAGYARKNELKELGKKLDTLIDVSSEGKLKQNIYFDEHGVGVMTEKAARRERNKWS